MKSGLKKLTQVVLAALCFLLAVPGKVTAAPPNEAEANIAIGGQDSQSEVHPDPTIHGGDGKNGHASATANHLAVDAAAKTDDENDQALPGKAKGAGRAIPNGALPPGIAKKQGVFLPPGLAKKAARGEPLPPPWRNRTFTPPGLAHGGGRSGHGPGRKNKREVEKEITTPRAAAPDAIEPDRMPHPRKKHGAGPAGHPGKKEKESLQPAPSPGLPGDQPQK